MKWIWPFIIGVSALSVYIVTSAPAQVPPLLRAVVSFWFLLVCPGMAFVRLLKFSDRLAEWILAVALSLAINAIVAGVMVYTNAWSPEGGLRKLIIISLAGAALQFLMAYSYPVNRWLKTLTGEVNRARKSQSRKPDSSLFVTGEYQNVWIPQLLLFAFSVFTIIGGLAVIAFLFM